MRALCVAALLVSGCISGDLDDAQMTADMAVGTAVAMLRASGEADADSQPKPGDPCPNCNGRGFVGDGVVRVQCQACNGGGKVIASVLVHPPAVRCESGTCRQSPGAAK